MARCIIFCAGECDGIVAPIEAGDFIIAADGGYRHVLALGIHADEVLGDFDSLGFAPAGANIFPTEKDDTDAMLAIRRGLLLGFREFVLYGALDGARLDHTVANFAALQFLADHGASGTLVGLTAMVTLVKNGAISFPATARGLISVFCHGADAYGVTLENLKYPLTDAPLSAGFPLGASNEFIGKSAKISVKDGSLLVIWERKNGFARSDAQ